MNKGKVYLVGAGPGDAKLITLRGLECIRQADVLLYDRLAPPHLLHLAPPHCKCIDVGKRPNCHTVPQDEIIRLLVEHALAGKVVTRLKGGDPCVFGRVAEEAEALRRHDIPFEIVPGVTSAIAVPAYAGIPVTARGISPSFAVVTGHEDPEKGESTIRWEHLAQATDTLVFLMGVKNLPLIVQQLVQHGKSPATPVALIRWGTRAEQETLVGTLGDIVEKVEAARFRPPATIVVGEVVRLRPSLQWFEHKPLFGQRILITRAQNQAGELARRIDELGGEPYEFPVIQTVPPRHPEPLEEAIRQVETFDWIVFTSVNGVRFFLDRLRTCGVDIRAMRGQLVAVGPKTAEVLKEYGLIPWSLPSEFSQEGVIQVLQDQVRPGQKVLFPRGNLARRDLPETLQKLGCSVTEVDAYETLPASDGAKEVAAQIKEGKIHVITFTSSSTVKNFCAAMQPYDVTPSLEKVTIAAIGRITAETARQWGLHVDVVAGEATIDGLLNALSAWLRKKQEVCVHGSI